MTFAMTHDPIPVIQSIIDHPEVSDGAPPFTRRMGFDEYMRFTRVAVGEFDLEWTVEQELCHVDGFVQGGITVVVADVAQSFAFWSTSTTPEAYSTTDFHTRYLRPIRAGRVVGVESRVNNRSKRTAAIESRFINSETGKLLVIVTGGWLVVERNLG